MRLLLLVLLMGLPGLGQDSHIRVQRDAQGRPLRLQTSITSLKEPGGARVDLVSVIHIGDADYYERLNQHFGNYESVLFEMVLDVPRSVQHQNEMRVMFGYEKRRPQIDTSRGGRDPVSKFQKYLADLLGLSFQLKHIDYRPPNLHHADLTLEEFEEAMASRGESPASVFKKLTDSIKEDDPSEYKAIAKLPLIKIMAVGPTPEQRQVLKIGMAARFGQTGDHAGEIEGTALIQDRNTKALDVLAHRVKLGEKKLAIFYGAAHMPDFVSRLKKSGWKVVSKSWVSAWDLTGR